MGVSENVKHDIEKNLSDESERRKLVGTLARVLLGLVFLWHGIVKINYAVKNFNGAIDVFRSMGAPLPELSGPVVTVVETISGLALIIGAFVPLACLFLIIDMLGALVFVHAKNGFDIVKMGWELPLIYIIALIAVGSINYGKFGLDNALCNKFCKTKKL